MTSFRGEEAVRAHGELMHAIQSHGGKVSNRSSDPSPVQRRSIGRIYADASGFAQITCLTAEFGTTTAIVAFLVYVRPILLKWLDMKKERAIEIKHGDVSVRIEGDNDVDKALDVFKRLETQDSDIDHEG